jgi:hypothetical protein
LNPMTSKPRFALTRKLSRLPVRTHVLTWGSL